jgi:Cyclic nucleotide-binding domain
MTKRINYYSDINNAYIMGCLTRIPYFENLEIEDKNALAFNFELKTFKKGALL